MSTLQHEVHRVLCECEATGELVALHPFGDAPDALLVGSVRAVDPGEASFTTVSPEGATDPDASAYPLRRLVRLSRGGPYLEGVRALQHAGVHGDGDSAVITEDRSRFSEVLAMARRHGLAIEFTSADHPRRGAIVMGLGDDWLCVVEDTDGGLTRDGVRLIALDVVTSIEVNTPSTRAAEFLLHRHGNPLLRAWDGGDGGTLTQRLERVLAECAATRELVEIRCAAAAGTFWVARVRDVIAGNARCELLAVDGRFLRTVGVAIGSIESLARHSAYAIGIGVLSEQRGGAWRPDGSPEIRTKRRATFGRVLDEARELSRIVSVVLPGDDSFDGAVRCVGQDYVALREVGDGGLHERADVLLRLRDVRRLELNTIRLQALAFLDRWQHEPPSSE